MWALVSGKSYTEIQFGTGPLANWATRLMGSATPVVVDILVLLLVAGLVLVFWKKQDPVRKKSRAEKRDLTHRR
jgi:hypothetical protein